MVPPVRGQWVRRLRNEDPEPIEPVCLPVTIEKAVSQVGQDAVDWAVRIARDIAVRAMELEPGFGGGEAALRSLRLGTESVAIGTLIGIDAGGLDDSGATPESEPMMQHYVHRRMPLERIWASIRLGHAWFAEHYMSACRDLVELGEQPAQLELISRVLFEFVNGFSRGVGETYHDEEQRWLASAAAARDETVRTLLSGADHDPRTASRTLRYDLTHQFHLGMIFCQEGTGAVDATGLHKIASATLAEFGATSTLLVPVGRTELWAWGGSRTPFPDVSQLAPQIDLRGVQAATGDPGRGVEGFRRTHLEAQEAARVVLLAGHGSPGVSTYSQLSLLALLTTNVELARSFLHRELGRLAGDDPQAETLRETLLTYLDCRRSPQTSATQLFVAKNTVIYRVRRAEELLGRSVDERPVELWAALLLARTLGTDEGRDPVVTAQPVARSPDGPSATVTSLRPATAGRPDADPPTTTRGQP